MSITTDDIEEIDGQTSDMIIQKQIISTNQLLEKVELLKVQIDAGDLDGKDILASTALSEVNSPAKIKET